MSKKVCHITSVHGRYDVRIFMKQCRTLASNGYDVTLIVNDDKADETKDGVKIVSTGFSPRNRVERFLRCKNLLFKKALETNSDIYQIHDPDLLFIGNRLKSAGKKVIFDSHEDVPKQIMEKYYIPVFFRGILSICYKVFEKYSLSRYDALISVTPQIVKRLLNINENSYMVTNYPIIDSESITNSKSNNVICFAGTINEDWKHDKIVKALEHIDNISYSLAGPVKEEYLSLLKELPAWGKVDYKGKVSHTQVKEIYRDSIVGMALHFSHQLSGEGSLGNTKLFEYFEAGIPVICTNYQLWKDIIDKHNCGIAIDPDNIHGITEAIKYFIENPDKAKSMGENARQAALNIYNWETQEKILLGLYKNILS